MMTSLVQSGERVRIARHIELAERSAAAVMPEHPSATRMVRELLLEALAEYRSRGIFPTNDVVADRKTPIFVDRFGVRCAMAHLIEISGGAALVERLARERNFARIHELADEPELVEWLGAAGLSLDEAAAIQPSYCFESQSDQVCFGVRDYAEGTVVEVRGELGEGEATVRVDWTSNDGAVAVGATLPVLEYSSAGQRGNTLAVGARVVGLVNPVPDGGTAVLAVDKRFESDGRFVAGPSQFQQSHPLSKETALRALTSETAECARVLAEADPAWSRSICKESEHADDGGCNAAAASANGLSSAVLLAALLAYRAHRRRRVE